MHLLDPKLGGKVRAVVRILSAVVVVLSSPAIADFHFSWVANVIVVANALLAFLVQFTPVGNSEG